MPPVPQSRPPAPNRPAPSRRRRLLGALVPPGFFDFWAGHVSKTLSFERPLARIVAVERASADAVTLVLRANRHWQGCAPGQHVSIGAEVDGRRVHRSYSPSVIDPRRRLLAITVKTIDGGLLSGHLATRAKRGDVLEIGQAYGAMTLPEDPSLPVLLLAAGSGITPLMAMLRTLARREVPTLATLLYWSRRRDQLCYVDELRALAASVPGLRVRFLLTGEAATAADEGEGRLDTELLATHVPDLALRHVYACGPGGFVDRARAVAAADAAAFQAEAFTLPDVAPATGGKVEVRLARSGRSVQVERGVPLLAALEAQGIKHPNACRMGLCNTCACGKRAGTTRHLIDGLVDSEAASALRICVSAALTDIELDL
ncbi:ferredoxin reductase [Arenimonas composti]|uniref:FAD-binding FR-type domain-containing protein n=1 Tax=Arenimonas composti TR7-09 = DSM 18010 TaxID=1121013 RepID=A0A091BWU3_9GAMM|nr:ferredoxin reductase [Arenimonas composti]KFN48815.1 hypothetical protein P873_13465 [Arenimonas composti TR7-09 = DSM 18010]